jgi:thiol-disulfide isomerase/thioredoxin
MGKIMKPITVKNNGDIMKAVERIMAGPITMVVVMAEWCGHCQDLKPKYNTIMANSKHTIQNVAIDEKFADEFNEALTKSIPSAEPLSVKGFPSILLLDEKGTVKSAVPNDEAVIKSTTENLGNSPSISKKNNNSKNNSNNSNSRNNNSSKLVPVTNEEEEIPSQTPRPVIKVSGYMPASVNQSVKQVSMPEPTPISKKSYIASPPLPESSIVDADTSVASLKSPAEELKQGGGSLYGSIASAAYKLAPPAVLMAAAATLMKRKGKGKKNRTKKNRRV